MRDIVERLDRIKWMHKSPEVAGVIIDAKQEIERLRADLHSRILYSGEQIAEIERLLTEIADNDGSYREFVRRVLETGGVVVTIEEAIERERLSDELRAILKTNTAQLPGETYEENLRRRAALKVREKEILSLLAW